jgi:hypothetical protein
VRVERPEQVRGRGRVEQADERPDLPVGELGELVRPGPGVRGVLQPRRDGGAGADGDDVVQVEVGGEPVAGAARGQDGGGVAGHDALLTWRGHGRDDPVPGTPGTAPPDAARGGARGGGGRARTTRRAAGRGTVVGARRAGHGRRAGGGTARAGPVDGDQVVTARGR